MTVAQITTNPTNLDVIDKINEIIRNLLYVDDSTVKIGGGGESVLPHQLEPYTSNSPVNRLRRIFTAESGPISVPSSQECFFGRRVETPPHSAPRKTVVHRILPGRLRCVPCGGKDRRGLFITLHRRQEQALVVVPILKVQITGFPLITVIPVMDSANSARITARFASGGKQLEEGR